MPSGPAALRQGCALTLRHPYRRQSRWDCRLPDSMQAAGFFFYPPCAFLCGALSTPSAKTIRPDRSPVDPGGFLIPRALFMPSSAPLSLNHPVSTCSRSLSPQSGCFPGSSSFPQELLKPAFFGGTSGDGPESQGPLSPPGHILERHPGQAGPVRDRDAGRSRCRTVSSARPFRPEPFSWRYDYESLSRSIRIRGARSVE